MITIQKLRQELARRSIQAYKRHEMWNADGNTKLAHGAISESIAYDQAVDLIDGKLEPEDPYKEV